MTHPRLEQGIFRISPRIWKVGHQPKRKVNQGSSYGSGFVFSAASKLALKPTHPHVQ
jgi:hypothetical protein